MRKVLGFTRPSLRKSAVGVPSHRWHNPIAVVYGRTLMLLLPLVFLSVTLSPLDAGSVEWFNSIAPAYLVIVNAFAAYRIAKEVPAALWSPAFWILISTAVFFGFGALVEVYGNYATQLRLSVGLLVISEAELFSSNRLSIVSIFSLFLSFWYHTQAQSEIWQAVLQRGRGDQQIAFKPETLTIIFVVGGIILVHGIIMPSQWGQTSVVVPGALTSISAIVNVGFAMATYLGARGSKRMALLFALLWPFHLLLTLLAFSKSLLMIALLLPAIGAYLGHRRMLRLGVSALVIVGLYTVSQDFVHYGRGAILEDTGTIWQAGYGERTRVVGEYFTSGDVTSRFRNPTEETQEWWMRLNYANLQAIGMRFREDAVGMDTLSNVWMMFIPRMIWPNKPSYIGPGAQFYTLMSGNEGTNVGISVFGDVYWQFGWLGIVIIIPMIGWMFAMMAWRSIEAIEQQNFIRMPLVLLSILVAAQGLTKWLANGIIASIPIYVGYLLLIHSIERYMRTRRHRGMRTFRSQPSRNVKTTDGAPD